MKNSILFAAVIALGSAAFAQSENPGMGTWKLNLAKSKFSPGPPPKSMTVKFEPVGEGQKLTAEGVAADGKPLATEYTANFDGKDYPLKGSPIADTVSLKRIDARNTVRTDKKGGKVVQTLTRVIAEDGKSFTVTAEGKNAKGQAVHNVAVFEKQ